MPDSYRQWVYARPIEDHRLRPENFERREHSIPDLEDGQALIRVKLINIHSATRQRMISGATALGQTDLTNYACAEVIRSRDRTFREGDIIHCQAGWQDYQVISSADRAVGYGPPSELVKAANGTNSQWNYVFRPEMVRMWPPEVLLDVFGTSGTTAYFGMRECGPLMPGDAVAVAGASGSVGAIVAQLAKAAGCIVVGFAGGADRCRWVEETIGVDRCLDYRAADLEQQIAAAFPNGIDVFSDGIAGDLLKTVSGHMNRNSRLFAYGTAGALYADTPQPVDLTLKDMKAMFGITGDVAALIADRNIKVEAWVVSDFYHERIRAEDDLSRLMLAGRLKPVHTIVDGFETLPEAITDLYATPRAGKLQIRFA